MSEQEPIIRRLGVYAQTGTGVCTAIHEALTRNDAASRYWTLDSYAGTVQATTAIVLRCTATNARLVIRAADSLALPTVLCSYHPAPNTEGETEEAINLSASLNSNLTTNGSPELKISSASYAIINGTYGIKLSTGSNLNSGFMVEMEDAITIVFNGNAVATSNNWAFSCHAGIIMSPDNLSDASYGVDGSGIMCGLYGTYNSSTGGINWIHTNSAYNVESRVRVGPTSWEQINVPRLYPSSGNYVTPVNIAPIGDAGNIERLVPWRLYGETGGALGSMRYVRQRYLIKAVAVTIPALASGHLTDMNNVVVGKNDKVVLGSNPNIAWIHQIAYDGSASATQQNLVHIWNNNGYVS